MHAVSIFLEQKLGVFWHIFEHNIDMRQRKYDSQVKINPPSPSPLVIDNYHSKEHPIPPKLITRYLDIKLGLLPQFITH